MIYLGVNAAAQLATTFHGRFRVVLIEKNSHFQHLFAFPRFAVATGVDTHKAFIPFVPGAFAGCPPGSGTVVQAKAIGLNDSAVQLDRQVSLDEKHVDSIPYSYLVSQIHHAALEKPPSKFSGHCYWHETYSTIQHTRIQKAGWCELSTKTRTKSSAKLENCHYWRRRSRCTNGH